MTSDTGKSYIEGVPPPIALVWRRVAAFGVDIVLLTIALQVMGVIFSSLLYRIGPYGRIIGLGVVLVYFAASEARFGMGQTLGKRWLGIAVRDASGKPIGPGRAAARNLVWVLPLFAIGGVLALPEYAHAVGNLVLTASVGIFAALLYTAMVNRKTGQALHDMLVGTYVVTPRGPSVSAYPHTGRIHWLVSAALIALGCLASVNSFLPNSGTGTVTQATRPVYDKLWADDRFFVTRVEYNEYPYPTGQIFPIISLSAWAKELPAQAQRVETVDQLARLVLDTYPGVDKLTSIEVMVYSGYDLGLAWGNVVERKAMSPNEWFARVGK